MDMSKREIALAALIAIGLGCVTYGLGLAWTPAWWIVGGLSLIAIAVLMLAEV